MPGHALWRPQVAGEWGIVTSGRMSNQGAVPTGQRSRALAIAVLALGAPASADSERIAGETELADMLGGSVEGFLLGREGVGLAWRDDDCPPVVVPNDVVGELQLHGDTLPLL